MTARERMMEVSDNVRQSEDARAQGNALYKSGDLARAIEWYQKAHRLDPNASAPLSNLAAASFELGDYTSSNEYAERALYLLSHDEAGVKSRIRLNLRRIRAFILLKQYDSAKALIAQHSSDDSVSLQYQQMSNQLAKVLSSDKHDSSLQIPPIQSTTFSPFKPTIGESSQIEIVGEDTPASLFDSSLLSNDDRKELSFFFANFGDARHVFATLIHVANPAITKPADLQFNLTLSDITPVNVARLLVLLSLLEELTRDDAQMRRSKGLAVLFHVYITPIMPGDLYEELQRHIAMVIDGLENKRSLPMSLDLSERQSVLDVLQFWQQDAQSKFPASWVRDALEEKLVDMLNPDIELFPASLRKEAKLFRKTSILRSSLEEGVAKDTATLSTIMGPEELSAKLQSIDQHWRSNVTLLTDSKYPWQGLTFDPFDFGSRVATKEIEGTVILADIICEWLLKVVGAIKTLRDCIHIELHASAAFLPSLSSSALPTQISKDRRLYDRIHLSQLPDLTGGTLFVYLFAVPLLRPSPTSYVTWKCMSYSEVFTSWPNYDLEFLAIPGDKAGASAVERLFLVKADSEVHAEDPGSGLFNSTSISGFRRARPVLSTKLTHEQLMPRSQLMTWLYRLLFKLVLPHIDQDAINPVVTSPFNLSAFVRLLPRLCEIGYPAHWLSDILDSVLSGSVRTSARQPASNPLKLKEVKASLAERDLDTSFLVPELQTLLGVMGDTLSVGTLHDVKTGFQPFYITFETVAVMKEAWATYLLVLNQAVPDHGDEGLNLSKRRQAQLSTIKTISTFEWDATKGTARFYMSSATMEALIKDGYHITLWHSESWSAQSERRPLSDCRTESVDSL